MNKIHQEDYLYATARLRTLERNMLTRRDLDKMLDAATFEESYKIASDISLHSSLPCGQYEAAIGRMLEDTYRLLEELIKDREVLDVFRLKYDGHNLKVLIKSQALGTDPSPLLSPLGILPRDTLPAQFAAGELPSLPQCLRDAAQAASDMLAKSSDPQTVDILIDRAVLEGMLALAQEIDFPFLTDVVRTYIDLENIRCVVRLKRIGSDAGLFQKLIVDGGKIPVSQLYEAFLPEGFDALRETLFRSEYSGALTPLLDALSDRKPLTAFERGTDSYLIEWIRRSKLVAFGLEPVISYLLAKENEAKQIRIILASRRAGVAKDKISERLRDTYA